MWLLSNEGNFLGGKRIWLSPGTEHLFGRGKDHSGPNCYMYPEQKSFSRKHLVIQVKDTEPDVGGKPDRKSEVVLRDLGSKFGTELDGDKFTGSEKVIATKTQGKEVHSIKMGQCKDLWRLEWRPVNLTLSSQKAKKKKSQQANSQDMQEHLESCDVKFTERFQPQHTTHVIASKRNTPKGLQALVSGKWIVTSAWLDALERQVSKPEVAQDEEQPMSALALDFDANWPNEADFIPDVGQEPVPRDAALFRPNPERESVFKGYTFVFTDDSQYAHLAPVIEQGSGKALFHDIDEESTRAENVVQYIKSVAGENGMGEFEDGSEGKGVVLVRPRDDDIEKARIVEAADIILGQRSIRQGDFLDAIVMNDATGLRKQLEESVGGTPFPTPQEQQPGETPASSAPPPSTEPPPETRTEQPTARRRGFRRAVTTSRFKGFDTFDPSESSSLPPPPEDGGWRTQVGNSIHDEPSPVESQISAPSRHVSEAPAVIGRKRPYEGDTVVESTESRENKVDKILPASAAMKRRRIEQGFQTSSGEGTPTSEPISDGGQKSAKPSAKLPFESRKKKVEEINVQELTKERLQKEEQQRIEDEEALREGLEGMDIGSIRNLAQVEEMEVKPRKDRLDRGDENPDSARWKAEWNGRKNFKKFRKRRRGGPNDEAPLRGRKVIVRLEEVKQKDPNIINDELLGDQPDRDSSRRRGSLATIASSRNRLLGSRDDDSGDDGPSFRRRAPRSNTGASQQSGPVSSISTRAREDVELQNVEPEEIAGEARNQRIASMAKGAKDQSSFGSDRSRNTSHRHTPDSESQSQTIVGDSFRPSTANSTASSRGKRPAMGPPYGSKEPSSKKSAFGSARSATLRSVEDDDDDSGDELRFRRRRK
ncbi:uncharacterized protein J3D65DRAFT_610002 [Phyllosticta citribraziliensis]|uniref:FHA domain-containing protein n=1 Tax=Phyllosticta citribraziliensis TaxID=989973 RepID=A0ABR1M9M6_9PEZI